MFETHPTSLGSNLEQQPKEQEHVFMLSFFIFFNTYI